MGKAYVIITFRIMPSSPDVNLAQAQKAIEAEILKVGTKPHFEVKPFAFGLKAIEATFQMDEAKGGTDDLEASIKKVHGVESVETIRIDRALG